MKNKQRILSLLLALALVFSLWSPAYALEGSGVSLSMTASQSSVKVGEAITVTIETDKAFTTRGSGMTIYYDAEKLEPDLDRSSASAPLQIHAVTVNGKAALRVSFLPGLEPATFSASEALAQICFNALSVTEKTSISMGAAYLYDDLLTEIALERPASIDLTIEPSEGYIPVTGITLDKTELTMEEGEMEVLKATVEPIGASNPTVIWTSSNEKVAVVSDGVIKALAEGTATITATTKEGEFTASCTVTVTAPIAGYTAKMPADTAAVIGGTIKIPVVIGNEDEKIGYNAFDISFTYDPEILELVSTQIPGVTVTAKDGKLNVLGYGKDRTTGSVPFTLEFKALKLEATEVKITSARVDNSGNAVVKNAALATLLDDMTAITVTGYPVTLPEGFAGESSATPGEAYTFTEPNDYYDYTVRVTVCGKEVTVTKNSDGSYTIPAELITGEIVVTATKTGKTFKVTLGTDMTGSATARYGTDYVATIDRDESYRYTVTLTIGGKDYTGYAASGKTYTIPGEDITGEIVFKVEKTLIVPVTPPGPTDPTNPSDPTDPTKPEKPTTYHSVTFTGSAAGAAQGNADSVAHGSSYTFSLKKQTGYNYQVTYTMGGTAGGKVWPNGNGTYTIANVTAPLVINIEKTLNIEISVHEYLTLDEKSVFLILADAALGSGSVFTYDGNVMYYSEGYGAWCYLVITDEDLDLSKVQSLVRISAQNNRVLQNPEVLLLDEPTKGVDNDFKITFAGILKELTEKGVCIIMVSHDVEFCAQYADRCGLFFDGGIVTMDAPQPFFAGKSFYTTAANRMARHLFPNAVTPEDVIVACGGEVPKREIPKRPDVINIEPPEERKPQKLPRWRKIIGSISGAVFAGLLLYTSLALDLSALYQGGNFLGQYGWLYILMFLSFGIFAASISRKSSVREQRLMSGKLSTRTKITMLLSLLLIPLTIWAGLKWGGGRKYMLISFAIIFETMLPFFLIFEGRKPQARELVILSVLSALAIGGRAVFFAMPGFKPVAAMVILTGVAFGAEAGFMVGAMTMFCSNVLFGQGPWTPWQMFAMGIMGLLAGICFRKGILHRERFSLSVFGGLVTFLIYGGIMNPASVLMYQANPDWQMILTAYITGVPADAIHALATAMFLWFLSEPMLEKLDRVKVKYGLIEK